MSPHPDDEAPATPPASPAPYVAPMVTVLGSLADLTQGGTDLTESDGFGGAGDTGSI